MFFFLAGHEFEFEFKDHLLLLSEQKTLRSGLSYEGI